MSAIQKKYAPFGSRLRSACAKVGIQQQELADIIGVSRNTISSYATGGQLPSGEKLIAIGKALKVSLDFLLLGTHPEELAATGEPTQSWLQPLVPLLQELDEKGRIELTGWVKGYLSAQPQKKEARGKSRKAS